MQQCRLILANPMKKVYSVPLPAQARNPFSAFFPKHSIFPSFVLYSQVNLYMCNVPCSLGVGGREAWQSCFGKNSYGVYHFHFYYSACFICGWTLSVLFLKFPASWIFLYPSPSLTELTAAHFPGIDTCFTSLLSHKLLFITVGYYVIIWLSYLLFTSNIL